MKEAPSQTPQAEIDSSLMNLLAMGTFYNFMISAEGLLNETQNAGYNGVEWHPISTPGIFLSGKISDSERVRSLHQSYRSEKNLGEAWRHLNRALAIQSYFLLPERVASLDSLEKIQTALGKTLDIVLYPTIDPSEDTGVDRPFGEKLYQPTAGVMQLWGIISPLQLPAEGLKRGYTGIAYDTAHARTIGPWQMHLPALLESGVIKEVHVSVGRIDMGYQNTLEELSDLMYGTIHTELPYILDSIARSGWKGRIVTEIPAAAIQALTKSSGLLPPTRLIESHRRIVDNLQDTFA